MLQFKVQNCFFCVCVSWHASPLLALDPVLVVPVEGAVEVGPAEPLRVGPLQWLAHGGVQLAIAMVGAASTYKEGRKVKLPNQCC